MNIFGYFAFLNPWMLAAFLALPALWFLLRITPPAPRRLILPTTRFLKGLKPERQSASHTPFWLLIFRMLIISCFILALAHPVKNPAGIFSMKGPIRLVIDNGWDAAQTWTSQMREAENNLARMTDKNKYIYIVTTAPAPGTKIPAFYGPLSQGEAKTILKNLAPVSWSADDTATLKIIRENQKINNARNIWLSTGLTSPGFEGLASELQKQGSLIFYTPSNTNLPVLLRKSQKSDKTQISVEVPDTMKSGTFFIVQALTAKGSVIDQQTLTWQAAGSDLTSSFKIPPTLQNEVAEFKIAGHVGAGALYKIGGGFTKKSVGVIGPTEKNAKPFIESAYYIDRALEPFATLYHGDYETVLKHKPSVIILSDIANIAPDALEKLQKWVEQGGTLLRFAGPNMAASNETQYLLPVTLRAGDHAAGGTLSWEKPAKLENFLEKNPLSGLKISQPISIRKQVLANAENDIEAKTWANLDNGTPFITASPLEKGLIILIHTSATPDWSDLPLSGIFVEILQRVIALSGKNYITQNFGTRNLQPVWVLDGLGVMQKPQDFVQPIATTSFAETRPDSFHPPGAYGHDYDQRLLNIGDHIETLSAVSNLPAAAAHQFYGKIFQRDYMADFLWAAFCLFLLDWMIMICLARGIRFKAILPFLFIILLHCHPAAADTTQDAKYADDFYLAYIQTGDEITDATSQRGLQNLSKVLDGRTAVEPAGVAELDPEKDVLSFFPFLYWPISAGQKPLSAHAVANLQDYLDNGGTILFDTRDGSEGTGGFGISTNSLLLQKLLGGFNIPPMKPLEKDHVLLRSFYLLHQTPGRFENGALWLEANSAPGRDGVSSVIIGTYDWAGIWAAGNAEYGASRQQELAFRFGVNMVMYALTGNYKSDQVHVSHILERLGE